MLSEYSSVNSNTLEGNVGISMVRPMMSHDVRFYMKYSTVFSPVNTIIQTRIVLRVLPDNQKNFTQSQEIENLNFNPLFPTLKLDLCKNYSFADAQAVARVFIYNSKHIGMVSLSYFENQILTLESLPKIVLATCVI